jgi:hypothetical protein
MIEMDCSWICPNGSRCRQWIVEMEIIALIFIIVVGPLAVRYGVDSRK